MPHLNCFHFNHDYYFSCYDINLNIFRFGLLVGSSKTFEYVHFGKVWLFKQLNRWMPGL